MMRVLADSYVDWASMWKILVISVCVGAGLVTVYAVGLRALSASGYLRVGEDQAQPKRNAFVLVAAIICIAIVAAGALYGLNVMFDK
jgi:hypothetical protein